MARTGLFITFEGGEGSGKTTQIKMLEAALKTQNKEVILTREPGGCPGAEEIRKLLVTGNKDRWDPVAEIYLFSAARRAHLIEKIWPAMDAGKIVICDRYADSTMAYQGYGYGDDKERQDLVRRTYHDIAGSFKPDLTIVLDIPVEIGLKRSKRADNTEQRFETKEIEFHERLRQAYLKMAKEEPDRFLVVNANQAPEKVSQDILNEMAKRGFFLKIQRAVFKGAACKPTSHSR